MSTGAAGRTSAVRGFLRRVGGWFRHPFRSWTLRRKLVAAVAALIAVLGVAIGIVSVVLLNDYLIGRVDAQLELASQRGLQLAVTGYVHGQPVGADTIVTYTGQPGGTLAALLDGQHVTSSYYQPTGSEGGAHRAVADADFVTKMTSLPQDGTPTSVNLGGNLGEYRVASEDLPDGQHLIMGLPLAEAHATTEHLAITMLFATIAASAFAAGIGLLIVRLSLRPLDRVAGAATTVSTLPLDRGEVALRVRVADEDTDPRTEVGRVGNAFNAMLGHVASALTAREASERKVRQFISDASHELRTPLASIRGYSELTRRSGEVIPPDVQHSIGRIESEAKRMTTMVEDLLLLARLDEGRELDREPVDLSMLLINLLSDAHAAGPDHSWRIDLPGEPVEVIGDQTRLHQVFANLLTNARVHTPAGTTVTLGMRPVDDYAEVTVVDDGPGVPTELQPVLFERFARGDSSRSRETGSTGLGLAIVKAVVDAQGGSIAVESEPGRTAFIVRLPLVPVRG
ncbi:sensor histidine kinase [Gryllotalpicola protaetiae]|uniref:histidine kinase n=1 Tax=Gryllotalpicola protaetiae TaxID=2419771 RepID=A0A387C0E9_9MICO|nr:HAMP domain-containing sensor histidine kinase [Gryllotalpicola protaetiae]AYG04021.1 HAMP domain-containing protein [Gryllotalpicola protaetiae]